MLVQFGNIGSRKRRVRFLQRLMRYMESWNMDLGVVFVWHSTRRRINSASNNLQVGLSRLSAYSAVGFNRWRWHGRRVRVAGRSVVIQSLTYMNLALHVRMMYFTKLTTSIVLAIFNR